MGPRLDPRFMGSCSVTARLLQVVLEMSPPQTRYLLPFVRSAQEVILRTGSIIFAPSHDSYIDVVISTGHLLPTYRG